MSTKRPPRTISVGIDPEPKPDPRIPRDDPISRFVSTLRDLPTRARRELAVAIYWERESQKGFYSSAEFGLPLAKRVRALVNAADRLSKGVGALDPVIRRKMKLANEPAGLIWFLRWYVKDEITHRRRNQSHDTHNAHNWHWQFARLLLKTRIADDRRHEIARRAVELCGLDVRYEVDPELQFRLEQRIGKRGRPKKTQKTAQEVVDPFVHVLNEFRDMIERANGEPGEAARLADRLAEALKLGPEIRERVFRQIRRGKATPLSLARLVASTLDPRAIRTLRKR